MFYSISDPKTFSWMVNENYGDIKVTYKSLLFKFVTIEEHYQGLDDYVKNVVSTIRNCFFHSDISLIGTRTRRRTVKLIDNIMIRPYFALNDPKSELLKEDIYFSSLFKTIPLSKLEEFILSRLKTSYLLRLSQITNDDEDRIVFQGDQEDQMDKLDICNSFCCSFQDFTNFVLSNGQLQIGMDFNKNIEKDLLSMHINNERLKYLDKSYDKADPYSLYRERLVGHIRCFDEKEQKYIIINRKVVFWKKT